MDELWRFVAGLTGFKNIGWELVQSKDRLPSLPLFLQIPVEKERQDDVSSFLVQCLYEAHKKVNPELVLERSNFVCTPRSVFNCYALGYCVAVSRLVGQSRRTNVRRAEALVCGLKSQGEVCGSIHTLRIDSGALDLLADVVPAINLTHLDRH